MILRKSPLDAKPGHQGCPIRPPCTGTGRNIPDYVLFIRPSPPKTARVSSLRSASAIAALVLAVTGCGGNKIDSNSSSYVSEESLLAYRTWAWSSKRSLNLRDPAMNTPQVRGWLEKAIDAELATKGLLKAEAGSADLLVTYAAASRQMTSSQTFTGAGELSGSRLDEEGVAGPALSQSGTLDKDYEEGRLFVDLVDRRSGQTVYRGTARAAMLSNPSEARSVPRIKKAVRSMFKALPPR